MTQLALDRMVVDIPQQGAMSPLTMSLSSGQLWGVLGPNGVGKTTLLHTLAGILAPRSGRIELDATPLAKLARPMLAQCIGVMFQDHQDGFPATVYETVLLGRHPHLGVWQKESDQDHAIVLNALKSLDLLALQNRLITELSGGERQRVALAMLKAQQPKVWLVDEPTNHLDLNHQVRAMEILAEQSLEGDCVVASLHDVNLAARWCTHVLLLYPDRPPLWGESASLLTTAYLEPLYRQPLAVTELEGRSVFVPRST